MWNCKLYGARNRDAAGPWAGCRRLVQFRFFLFFVFGFFGGGLSGDLVHSQRCLTEREHFINEKRRHYADVQFFHHGWHTDSFEKVFGVRHVYDAGRQDPL